MGGNWVLDEDHKDWRVRLVELGELRRAAAAELKTLTEHMPKDSVADLIADNQRRVRELSAEIGALLDEAKELADAV